MKIFCFFIKTPYLCNPDSEIYRNDWKESLAQLVEHNTFNVGVSGSSPERFTKELIL